MNKKRSKKMKMNEKERVAENTIKKIADREGITVESVRKQMQMAMLNGLCSTNPEIKAFWDSIPRKKEVPTPEELIMYLSETIMLKDLV